VNAERLVSLEELAGPLAEHLGTLAEPNLPLPDVADLRALVQAAFFASLYEEEARRLEFGIAWQPDAHECATAIAIAAPVPLTPGNLAKLAPATAGEATSIAIRRERGHLVAWALLERATPSHDPLTVRVLSPGVIRIDYAGMARALYARGELILDGGAAKTRSPAQRLTRTFPVWASGADPTRGIDLRAAIAIRLAARMLAYRHGGMVLVIPAEVDVPAGVRVHYAVGDGASALVQRYARLVGDAPAADQLARFVGSRPRALDGTLPVRDRDQLAFADALDSVARLTAIDNALLLDTDLRVRGFGVQVLESDIPDRQFRHVNPYADDDHFDDLSTFKGTRHPAGVIFCMRQPTPAAAIIASQDGNLSLATKDADGAVEVLGRYVRAFGWK
jgi:hypothetical protein